MKYGVTRGFFGVFFHVSKAILLCLVRSSTGFDKNLQRIHERVRGGFFFSSAQSNFIVFSMDLL